MGARCIIVALGACVWYAHASKASSSSAIGDARREQCIVPDHCYFLERFQERNGERWEVEHDWANELPFNGGWNRDNVRFDEQNAQLVLSVDNKPTSGKPFSAAQVATRKWHGYGCYEVRMQPAAQSGVVTAFFSLTGPYDQAPGGGTQHNEVDIEFIWRPGPTRVVLQTNYFTDGRGGHEQLVELPADAHRAMHNYAFRWNSSGVEWLVDGVSVRWASSMTPKLRDSPHKVFFNMWPVHDNVADWAGRFSFSRRVFAFVDGVRFSSGERCAIANNFDP
ncbi:unnamed protein product [Agarophyton chilense]